MKKLFLLIVLTMVIANTTFGQYSDQEIWKKISQAKELNSQRSGVINPNKIYPNQVLTFLFTDGKEAIIVVEDGDSQWTIVRDKISEMEKIHGMVIDYPKAPELSVAPVFSTINSGISEPSFPWWIVFLCVCVSILSYLIYFISRERGLNPVTAGPAQIQGGIRDTDIASVLRSRYPNVQILSIVRGRLYGQGVPYYNFNRISFRRLLNEVFGKVFNGEVGYQADILTPNGERMLVQTLAGCGNDIRMEGRFITGLTFIPDGSQPEVLTAQEVATPEKKPVDIPTSVGDDTELSKIVSSHSIVASEFLKIQNAHKVTMKVTTAGGDTVETIMETKNTPQPKAETEEKK